MKVIEHIKQYGLDSLEEFGIIVKQYPEGLIVLNYDQINSPKTNDIVKECRGLIIDTEFNVVCRSFDRFFNYGEAESTFNPETAVAYEKIDGSLIKIYNFKDTWYASTRGTAFAESGVNGWDITFKDMVLKALDCKTDEKFQAHCSYNLDQSCTYIFEITAMENRVVTRYEGYTLWLLATRVTADGWYYEEIEEFLTDFGVKRPQVFKFSSVEDCIETAKHLPDLQEGYVIYEDGVPVCKVKSPAYVAVHRIKGEGLNPKRIAELVVINEQEEYLKYFPEDEKHFKPYVDTLDFNLKSAQHHYHKFKDIADQKEFALEIKDQPYAQFLFQARRLNEDNITKVFNSADTNRKVKFLLSLRGENE